MGTYKAEQTSSSILQSFAIDGPTASGKSVIGRGLAIRLGLYFCDTGLMYRAATLAVLGEKIPLDQDSAIVQCVQSANIDLQWDSPETPLVLVGKEDVTHRLKSPEIDLNVSKVARLTDVRSVLVSRQRVIADRSPVVMVGRDIGKAILPEARAKVFVDANLDERARRRLIDEVRAGREVTFDDVRDSIARRDQADNTGLRAISPDQAAEDAQLVNTDGLSEDEVILRCLEIYKEANV